LFDTPCSSIISIFIFFSFNKDAKQELQAVFFLLCRSISFLVCRISYEDHNLESLPPSPRFYTNLSETCLNRNHQPYFVVATYHIPFHFSLQRTLTLTGYLPPGLAFGLLSPPPPNPQPQMGSQSKEF
jgi:hypothetical protein